MFDYTKTAFKTIENDFKLLDFLFNVVFQFLYIVNHGRFFQTLNDLIHRGKMAVIQQNLLLLIPVLIQWRAPHLQEHG